METNKMHEEAIYNRIESEELRQELLMFVLERVPLHIFNTAIKQFSTKRLFYYVRNEMMAAYPKLMPSQLWFSIVMCRVFKPYEVDEIQCPENIRKINKLFSMRKMYPKGHPERVQIINEHNELVEVHNKMIEPQNRLIKLYKKIRKNSLKKETHRNL